MVSNINLKIEDDLEIALKASKKAGDIIMKYYKHDYEINEKGYHNPVTTADKEADSFLKIHYWMLGQIMVGFLKKQ